MKPVVLSVDYLPDFLIEPLRAQFDFHHEPHKHDPLQLASLAAHTRALVANGETVLSGEDIARFPALELIAVFGVGYDGIDIAAARARGIRVTHTPGVLTEDVADMAIALMLAVSRRIIQADTHVRSGYWKHASFPLSRKVSGSRLGIVGLGRIGRAVAARAQAFDMDIAYTDLHAARDVAYTYQPGLLALAASVDYLVLAAYGGPSTRGMIDAPVLAALGRDGYLINVARGSIVNEEDLVAALRTGAIAGAGLDVFADEPNVPEALRMLDNVVLTPHAASATRQTRQAMADLTLANLRAHFGGAPLPSEVPPP